MPETSESIAPSEGLENPLLKAWLTPFETPPFAQIMPEHFLPAKALVQPAHLQADAGVVVGLVHHDFNRKRVRM